MWIGAFLDRAFVCSALIAALAALLMMGVVVTVAAQQSLRFGDDHFRIKVRAFIGLHCHRLHGGLGGDLAFSRCVQSE